LSFLKTAFFPEGGGQPADTGSLAEARVLDVLEKGGEIRHMTDKPLTAGAVVSGNIDWEQRFRRMQNHSGEHPHIRSCIQAVRI
jgi:alanyl-tRNA synthetase